MDNLNYTERLWTTAKLNFEHRIFPALKRAMKNDMQKITVSVEGSVAMNLADHLSDIDMFIFFSRKPLFLLYNQRILNELGEPGLELDVWGEVRGFYFDGKGGLSLRTRNINTILKETLAPKNDLLDFWRSAQLSWVWYSRILYDPSKSVDSAKKILRKKMSMVCFSYGLPCIETISTRLRILSEAIRERDLLKWHIGLSDLLDIELSILAYAAHCCPWPLSHLKYLKLRQLSNYGEEIFRKVRMAVDSAEPFNIRYCILQQMATQLTSLFKKNYENVSSKFSVCIPIDLSALVPYSIALIDWLRLPMDRMMKSAWRNRRIAHQIEFGKSLRQLCLYLFYINGRDIPALNILSREMQRLPILGRGIYIDLKETFICPDWKRQHIVFNQAWKKIQQFLIKQNVVSLNDIENDRKWGKEIPGSSYYDRTEPN